MTPEKVKQYKVILGLLGIPPSETDTCILRYKISKHNTATYILVFNHDMIYKVMSGTYTELREEELDEIIQKYVAAKGKYDD